MDDVQLTRTLLAMNAASAGATAAHRTLEQVVFALVATHPDKKEFLGVVEHLLEWDKRLDPTRDEGLRAAYDLHRKRLIDEIRPICESQK